MSDCINNALKKAGFMAMALSCWSAPAAAENLQDAVAAALKNHPSVEAAMANREAYDQERKEQWADYFPQLNIRGAGGRIYGDNSTSRGLTVTRGAAYSYLWEGSVTLTQPIFDGFETANRVDAAELRRESANYNLMDVREDLALRTVIAYLDVLRSRETLKWIDAHRGKITDYRTRIQTMVEEGAADESMSVQAQDIMTQLENTRADIEGQLRAANANYLELTGHLPDDPMDKPDAAADDVPMDIDAGVRHALEVHPALKAASSTEKALGYEAEAEKQFYYPDVSGELSYLERDQEDEIGGEVVDAKAVVRLNWDLSLAGAQVARARKTLYRQQESKAQRAEAERRVEKDVRVAYSDLETAVERVGLQRERVTINETLFKNYEAQFEGARINLLQLLQADNALYNARLALINGEYRLLSARFAVLAAMGQLQEAMMVASAETNDN